MIERLTRESGAAGSRFLGRVDESGAWTLDGAEVLKAMRECERSGQPLLLLGTAFSFVQLFDWLESRGERVSLPEGSRVMETGGYKGRSRELPKTDLHRLISGLLGVPPSRIVSEYGMSELSSQAYDLEMRRAEGGGRKVTRNFRFPPWARVQVVSPETGREVGEGESGLIRVFDLANTRSVLAIQTEDLGVRRRDGFELIGRAALAEPRGCSLMSVH
jgi:hypothetical protein